MKKLKTIRKSTALHNGFAALALVAWVVTGCAGTHGQTSPAGTASGSSVTAAAPPAPAAVPSPASGTASALPASPPTEEPVGKGPQLWADNCGRCHNARSPSLYSDPQWEVIGMHMRVRANLTADDSRQILAFLKNAH